MATAPSNQKISPQQRNANFAQMTRQKMQVSPMKTGSGANMGDTVQFDIPKINLISRVRLLVTGNLKASHATATTFEPAPFAPFNLIRRVSVDLNNGFSPFILSGEEVYMYNMIRDQAFTMKREEAGRAKVVMGTKAAAGGANNAVSFLVDLPLTLNDRDPVGLIVAQNQETTITVTVDFANDPNIVAGAPTGYTFAMSNLKVEPMVESFTVPPIAEAFPDISVLKLAQASRETISGAGQHYVDLPCGYTYRKMIFYITDENGKGVADSDLVGNIELVLNQADIPYRLTASHLAKINHEMFGMTLPQGMYAFDFSYQGISNLGGARDYFDTERLTEFWLRFNPSAKGQVRVVYEVLSRLHTA